MITELANVFSEIIDNYEIIKDKQIKRSPSLLEVFETLEDLTGNLKRMIDKRADIEIQSKFTKSVRSLKKQINELVRTLEYLLSLTAIVIIYQTDLVI